MKALSNHQNGVVPPHVNSQITTSRQKLHPVTLPQRCILPTTFCISLPFPWGRHVRKVTGDFRKAGENIILLVSLIYGIFSTWDFSDNNNNWIALGGWLVTVWNYDLWDGLQSWAASFFFP